jgi:hypothetical protein
LPSFHDDSFNNGFILNLVEFYFLPALIGLHEPLLFPEPVCNGLHAALRHWLRLQNVSLLLLIPPEIAQHALWIRQFAHQFIE